MVKYLKIIFLLTNFNLVGQNITGHYDNNLKRHFIIDLNADNTFIQFNSDCNYKLETHGTWKTKGDTLILLLDKIYSLTKKNKQQAVVEGSLNYNTALQITKYLIKKDTLVILYGETNQWSFLPRTKQTGEASPYINKVDSIVVATKTNASLTEQVTHGLLEKGKIRGGLDITAFYDQKTNQVHRIIFDKLLDYFERSKFYYYEGGLIYASYEKGDPKTKTKLLDTQYYYENGKVVKMTGENASKKIAGELQHKSNQLKKVFDQENNK